MTEKKLYKGVVVTNGEVAEYYTHATDERRAYQNMKREHNYAYDRVSWAYVKMEIVEVKPE